MFNINEVKSFFDELNSKCKKIERFQNLQEKDVQKQINDVEQQSNEIISQMKTNLEKYLNNNFGYISKEIEKQVGFLFEAFKIMYKNSRPENSFDKKADSQELQDILIKSIEDFNILIEQLNGQKIGLDNHQDTNIDTPSKGKRQKEAQYAFLLNTNLDRNLVKKIFSKSKEIFALVDMLCEKYKTQFDLEGFKKEVLSKKKAYIDEISANLNSQLDSHILNEFKNTDNYYETFFENLDSYAKKCTPDIENGSNEFKEEMLLGYIDYPAAQETNLSYLKASNPLNERIDKNGFAQIPLVANLREMGNVVITLDQNIYNQKVKTFVEQLILGFLLSYPASRIHFKLVDINDRMGFAQFSVIKKINNNILLDGIVRDEKQLEEAIDQIKKLKFDGEDKLGGEGISNIFDYNEKYSAAPLDIYVFVLIDFPCKISLSLANKIRDIMLNGKNDGVFSILVDNVFGGFESNLTTQDYSKISAKLWDCSYKFKAKKDNLVYVDKNVEYNFKGLKSINISRLKDIVETLKDSAKATISKPIPLADMFEYIDKAHIKSISEEMEIPFGLCGGDVQTLKLTNQTSPHAALIGTSGSGKSVLFHTLILDACYKYSPEELNLYLLDFKGGVEFKYYQNHWLPHIKVIGLTNNLSDGLAILINLNKEIIRRKELFNKVGVNSIENYYKAGYKIPRLFVIIDEIQEVLVRDEKIGEKAINVLAEILAIGRSFGINLLWGSQSVPQVSGMSAKIMANITNRICLKVANSDYAMGMFGDTKALKAVENLNRPGIVGLGVIRDERTGSGINEFRVAYPDENEKRAEYVERILKKWEKAEKGEELYVVGNDLIPQQEKDVLYSVIPSAQDVDSLAFDSYWLSLAADYISGQHFPLEIENAKERENILIVGTNVDLLRDMMGYLLLSVILNRFIDKDYLQNQDNKVYYANKEGINPKYSSDLYNLLPKQLPEQFEIVGSDEKMFECIKELYFTYLERKADMDNGQIPDKYCAIYLFVHSLQYLSDLFEEDGNLVEDEMFSLNGQSQKNSVTFTSAFKTLLKKGGQYGIHFIFSINSIDSIREIKEELKGFNYKFSATGSNTSLLVDLPMSQIPEITSERVVLFINNNTIEKIRPFRFDEKNKANEEWALKLIQSYSKLK